MPHSISIGYNYQPLDQSKREIRILWVKYRPYHDPKPLKCRLQHISLDELLETENAYWSAISYTWGTTTQLRPASIDGKQVLIPDTAEAALRNCLEDFVKKGVRPTWERIKRLVRGSEFIFWIDVICIDQTNIQERNAQVQLMGSIYSSAPVVFVWLGNDEGDHAKVLFDVFVRFNKFMKSMPDLQHDPVTYLRTLRTIGQELYSSLSDNEWEALNTLYSSVWFRRTWYVCRSVSRCAFVIWHTLVQQEITQPKLVLPFFRSTTHA